MSVDNEAGSGAQQEGRLAILEREGRFPELATELATLVPQTTGSRRFELLARLGEVRLKLDDVARAISAFRESLEGDPKQAIARRSLEAMLATPEHALEAAQVLEPIYERDFQSDPHAATLLISLLELRASKATEEDEKIALWVQIGALFDRANGGLPLERKRELTQRMLRRTALEWPGGVAKWIERVARVGDPEFRAEAIRAALENERISPVTAVELEFAAGEALEAGGRYKEAQQAFERALVIDPSSPEVIARIDVLSSRAGESVEQRIARYRAAIENATETERRAALRYTLGELVDNALGDSETAMDLWKQALSEVPTLMRAHEALIDGYEKLGNQAAVERELERALGHLTGEEHRSALLKLVESLAGRGETERAVARGRVLLEEASYEDPALEVLERLAKERSDLELLRAVAQKRVDVAPDRAMRAQALEALAELLREKLNDLEGSAEALVFAAEQWFTPPEDYAESSRLYWRAFELSPKNPELAMNLLELAIAHQDWAMLPLAFRAVLGASSDTKPAVDRLLSLEKRVIKAGATEPFANSVDVIMARLADDDVAAARALLGAKARVLAGASQIEEAAELYETLIEAFCDEEDVREYVGLVETSNVVEFRHQKRRWLLEWRTGRAEDPVAVLTHWAIVEEQEFNDLSAAVLLLERALEFDPTRQHVQEELARLRLTTDDPGAALESLRRIHAHGGGSSGAALELAFSLVEHSTLWFEAIELLDALTADAESPSRAYVLTTLLETTRSRASGEGADPRIWALRPTWHARLLETQNGEAFPLAIQRALEEFPENPLVWDAIERGSVRLGAPIAAVRTYEQAIRKTQQPELAESLGRRLVAFADQHVDHPRLLGGALEAMLELVPSASWAFERLKFALGSEQRWSTLFPLYEQRIQSSSDDQERARLLDEAAIAARDVAGDPERAIRYWEEFFRLRPDDARVDVALERLYERQRKLPELIGHLERRELSLSDEAERCRSAERIAGLFVELGEGRQAIGALDRYPRAESARALPQAQRTRIALLERIFALPIGDDPTTFKRAAELLREHYASTGQTKELARIVKSELAHADEPDERRALLGRLAELARKLGDVRAEIDALSTLFALEPFPGALEERLEVAHRLEALLLESGQALERSRVLDRLAELEPEPDAQKHARLAAARIDELHDPARAAETYAELLEQEPTARELHDGLIRALEASGAPNALVRALSARAALDPTSKEAHRDRAQVARLLGELGDRASAITAWREIRALYERDQESFEALSALLEGERRWDELAALLAEEAERARVKGPIFQRLAEVHRTHTGDLKSALEAYLRANDVVAAGELVSSYSALLSDDPSLPLELASTLERSGRAADGERVLRKQLDHYGPRRPREAVRVHLRLAELLRAANRLEDSQAELVTASERHPSSVELQSALAEASREIGDYEHAEQCYRALLLLPPKSGAALTRAEVYLRLSDLDAERGVHDRASEHVASAFEAALASDEEAHALERALKERGRKDLLERAITLRLERTREPEKVLSALSDLVTAHGPLGEIDAGLGERALALADRSRKELEQSGAEASAFATLVSVYDAIDQRERAISVLEQMAARETDPDLRAGYALETVKRLLKLPERREQAIQRLWELIRSDPTDEARLDLLLGEASDGNALDELLGLLDAQLALAEQQDFAERLELLSVRRASALEHAGRLEEALAVYQGLAKSPPHRKRALGEVVRLLEALSAPKRALADAREALLEFESGPVTAAHAAALAELRREEGDRGGLERALTRGFIADPTRADVRDELFRLLAEDGRFERSAELLETAIQKAPDDGMLRLRLAEAYHEFGASPQALATLDAALAAGAPASAVHRERARVLEALGRFDAALGELDTANALEGKLDDTLFQAIDRTGVWREIERWATRAADLATNRKERTLARKMLEYWAEREPENAAILDRLGRLAALDRDYERAISAFRTLARVERGMSQRRAVLALARACDAAGRPEDARAELEHALAEGADTLELRRELAKLYARAGARTKHAELLLEDAREAKPPARAMLYLQAADLLNAESRWSEAKSALDRALEDEPERVDAVALKARILSRESHAEGRRYLEEFLAGRKLRDKRFAPLFRLLGQFHLAEDELAEAFPLLVQANQLDRSDSEAAFLLGMLAFDLDRFDVSASALRGLVAIKEPTLSAREHSRAYFVLACLEHARGQRTVARRMASRALEVDTTNEDARRLLGSLG